MHQCQNVLLLRPNTVRNHKGAQVLGKQRKCCRFTDEAVVAVFSGERTAYQCGSF